MNVLDFLRFRRLRSLPTATSDHEGQIRYVRNSTTTGTLSLARYKTGATYEWVELLSVAGGTMTGGLTFGASGPTLSWGTGSPETVVTAPVGSLYLRTDGGAGTSLYVKESGSGNTGWVGK